MGLEGVASAPDIRPSRGGARTRALVIAAIARSRLENQHVTGGGPKAVTLSRDEALATLGRRFLRSMGQRRCEISGGGQG